MYQKKNTVLLIEDDFVIRKILTISIEGDGYKVVECEQGQEGIQLAASVSPELILVDLSLPDTDGKEVIRSIREWSQVPILVCSARNVDEEVVAALNAGADDFIQKPFNPEVVLARIHANLRKGAPTEAVESELVNGDIRMDMLRHEVFLNDKKIALTPKEYELLRYFLIHKGKMLTHRDILKTVWGSAHIDDMQYLRVYVRQLRKKIEADSANAHYIVTELGIGYRMEMLPTAPVPEAIAA